MSEKSPRAPRRIVLLVGDKNSEICEVLREYHGDEISGNKVHADIQTFAAKYPGRTVAAEWLSKLGWTRFLWCNRPPNS